MQTRVPLDLPHLDLPHQDHARSGQWPPTNADAIPCQGLRGCRPAPRLWDREVVADDRHPACGLGRAAD